MDAAAVLDEPSGVVTLFAVNRDQHQPLALDIDLRACPELALAEHVGVFDDDPEAVNTAEQPDRVTPTRLADLKVTDGHLRPVLPPLSWSMIRIS